VSRSTSRPHAESLLRFLAQRADQLEVFHSGNARLVIQGFCDFVDRDDVISLLIQALERRRTLGPKAWHDQAVREGKVPPLPEDPAACMAFRYAVLKLVRMDKIDLRYFVTNLFPGSYLDEKLMHWKRLIVHPFAADCRTAAKGVAARLGDDEWVDLSAIIDEYLDGPFQTEGFGPRAWGDEDDRRVEAEEAARKQGGPAAASAPGPGPDLAGAAHVAHVASAGAAPAQARGAALAALEAAVRAAADLAPAEREDLLLDVAALGVELERRERAVERLRARLDDLAARPALAEAARRARAALERPAGEG
jgi:hypothetical protein